MARKLGKCHFLIGAGFVWETLQIAKLGIWYQNANSIIMQFDHNIIICVTIQLNACENKEVLSNISD
jgi:hypothetical protein